MTISVIFIKQIIYNIFIHIFIKEYKKIINNFKLKSGNYLICLLFFCWGLASYAQPHVEEKALLKSYDRSVGEKISIASEKRQRKYSLGPKELITMDDDKDRINKMTDHEKENLLKSIIKLASNLSDNDDDEVIKDFAYIAATSLLHLLK